MFNFFSQSGERSTKRLFPHQLLWKRLTLPVVPCLGQSINRHRLYSLKTDMMHPVCPSGAGLWSTPVCVKSPLVDLFHGQKTKGCFPDGGGLMSKENQFLFQRPVFSSSHLFAHCCIIQIRTFPYSILMPRYKRN